MHILFFFSLFTWHGPSCLTGSFLYHFFAPEDFCFSFSFSFSIFPFPLIIFSFCNSSTVGHTLLDIIPRHRVPTAEDCFGHPIDFLLNFSLFHFLSSSSCLQPGGTILVRVGFGHIFKGIPVNANWFGRRGLDEMSPSRSRLNLTPQAQVKTDTVMSHFDRRQPCYDVIDFTQLGLHYCIYYIIFDTWNWNCMSTTSNYHFQVTTCLVFKFTWR